MACVGCYVRLRIYIPARVIVDVAVIMGEVKRDHLSNHVGTVSNLKYYFRNQLRLIYRTVLLIHTGTVS
jgi:hypothetical protein